MIDPAFLSFLRDEESRAFDGTLMDEVETAIKSYNGDLYGDEEDGRSQVVARDVAETADYMLTSVLEAFVASGRVVEFEPANENDEDLADDVTEAMHYIYRRKSGYRLIHDWSKAGLLEKIGVVKSCVERKRKRVEGLYHPAMMPDNAIQAQETDQIHPVDGSPMIHAVTLEETAATFPDYHVPLEEFRVAPDARDLDSAIYLAHFVQKSVSELVEMGFDGDQFDTIRDSGEPDTVSFARDDGRNTFISDDRKGANRKLWLKEEYPLYDLNGDGIAERLCVHRVGDTILLRGGQIAIHEVDYQPFEYWCPYPMQGRLIGQSLADKTTDIQRVNTVLERNMLDGLYHNLKPRTYVNEDSVGDHTIDDLLTVYPGAVVRWKGQIRPEADRPNDMSSVAMQAIEFKIRQRESRTGITRLNKGVDEDTLNETAKGQAQLMSRGQQMERYIIRNFAEGVARLFMKKVGLMRKYAQPFQIRVDGQYRQVDPSQWPEDLEVQVVVGLGSGSKEDRIMGRQALGQVQALLKQAGSQIVTEDNLYNNAIGLARDFGLAPNDLFTEPPKDEQGNPIPQQQPPDPKVQALMAQVQVKQQAIEAQREADQMKLQQMAAQHADEAQLEIMRQHQEAALALREQNLQTWLDHQQMLLEAAKHSAQLDNQAKIAKMRPGGALNR
jgi:hypothetical protein